MQVYAGLQLPEMQNVVLITGRNVPNQQQITLPNNWTHIQSKQGYTSISAGKDLLQDRCQPTEADIGIADLV